MTTHIPPLVIGITGTRGAGKDTFFRLLQTFDYRFERYAFADRLKKDMAPVIRQHLAFDPDNLTAEQKEIVRHLWIGWGMTMRAYDPLHWVKTVVEDINRCWQSSREPFIPCITDARFVNEVECLRQNYGSTFVLIDLKRKGAPPPTDEEEKHFRQVSSMADYCVTWGNDDEEGQRKHVRDFLEHCGLLYGQKIAA